eukprot:503642-Prymnesium_polylepis.1
MTTRAEAAILSPSLMRRAVCVCGAARCHHLVDALGSEAAARVDKERAAAGRRDVLRAHRQYELALASARRTDDLHNLSGGQAAAESLVERRHARAEQRILLHVRVEHRDRGAHLRAQRLCDLESHGVQRARPSERRVADGLRKRCDDGLGDEGLDRARLLAHRRRLLRRHVGEEPLHCGECRQD